VILRATRCLPSKQTVKCTGRLNNSDDKNRKHNALRPVETVKPEGLVGGQ
jgi:hypothetical protein